MKLVIVESPAKAKTIARYLGNDFSVVASRGHICDLAIDGPDGLGVEVNNNFLPHYQINKDKVKTVEYLRKTASNADEVFLATDPDREGEAISWHLARILDLNIENTKRLEFHEITPFGINKAMENIRTIDLPLVQSQETRRIVDRIMGFKLSKLLQNKIRSLSAGRVQSVVLKLVVDREREILNFKPEEYWTINIDASYKKEKDNFTLTKINGEEAKISTTEEHDKIVALIPKEFTVKEIIKETVKHYPRPPLITSSLQQEAFNKFKYSTGKTMQIAQKLYEGITTSKGHIGLITYMRTDSTRLSPLFISAGRKEIVNKFGEDYVGGSAIKGKSNSNTQDAHEAIRPTHADFTPEELKKDLSKEEYNIYSLIYNRALAALMAPRVSDDETIIITGNSLEFENKASVTTFEGFNILIDEKIKDKKSKMNPSLNDLLELQKINSEQNFTKAPNRYSEAKLVKEMEDGGIGRPSTYATTIETLKKREYIISKSGFLSPSEQGMLTTDKLQEYFSSFINVKYTANMENKLDEIVSNTSSRDTTLSKFYQDFISLYQTADAKMEVEPLKQTGEMCPTCGNPLVIRKGKYGNFVGCSSYPQCNFMKKYIPENAKSCPKCQKGFLIVKKGPSGSFLACTDYPNCTYTEPLGRVYKKKS